MNKLLKLIIFIGLIIIQSCKKNNIIEHAKFDDGQELISYGENGIIDSVIVEKNNAIISKFIAKNKKKDNKFFQFIFYDAVGNISAKGDMYEKNHIGDWLYFKNKRLFKKEEYMKFCNKYFINQTWEYDIKGKINYDKSNFYSYKFIDTLVQNENISKILKIKFYPLKKLRLIIYYFIHQVK